METESQLGPWFPGPHALAKPDKTAVALEPAGATMSYATLDREAKRFARLLMERGLGAGDHVCLWFDNELKYPALWWGAHYAGLYYTLISSRLTAAEAAYIVQDSGSRVFVVGRRLYEELGKELTELLGGDVELIVDGSESGELGALMAASGDAPLESPIEGSAMLYSSGTTGRPKAVKRPQSGAPLGTSDAHLGMAQHVFGLNENSVYLSPAPLYHAAPYGYVLASHSVGATAVVMEKFDPLGFLEAIERHRVTHTQVVPTMFVRLLALPEEERSRFDLSSLQCVIHAAAPCPVPIKQQMMDWLGPVIHEYYAGTEGVGATYCSPTDWIAHPGSVGQPMMGAIRILDEDGAEVPTGVDGDVYFEGSPRFEYHNDSEKTAGSFNDSGWGTYGDIGHVDEDGFLYLTDRRANMIIVGGVNVYPQEAENALIVHPDVLDAAVFGIPHPEWGEEVVAVVRPADEDADHEALESTLLAYLKSQLASVKCPRRVDFRSELPRQPNGKLLKRLLRDEYIAK